MFLNSPNYSQKSRKIPKIFVTVQKNVLNLIDEYCYQISLKKIGKYFVAMEEKKEIKGKSISEVFGKVAKWFYNRGVIFQN